MEVGRDRGYDTRLQRNGTRDLTSTVVGRGLRLTAEQLHSRPGLTSAAARHNSLLPAPPPSLPPLIFQDSPLYLYSHNTLYILITFLSLISLLLPFRNLSTINIKRIVQSSDAPPSLCLPRYLPPLLVCLLAYLRSLSLSLSNS